MEELQGTLFWSANEGNGSEQEDSYEKVKKLMRESEYSESYNFEKLLILAQILSFW